MAAGLGEAVEPPGDLQPEHGRDRLLEQRAADHGPVAVRLGEARRGHGRAVEIGEQRLKRTSHEQHQRGVDDVLAGRAGVNVLARPRPQTVAQLGHEPDHRRRMLRLRALEHTDVDAREVLAVGDDSLRDILGDRPARGERPRARRLDVAHRPHPGGVGELARDASTRVDRVEHAYTAKKTVSPGPCRRMSKR